GSKAVILGTGPTARAVARELVSLGCSSLTVLSRDRVAAEKVLPVGAGAALLARSLADPVAKTMLELADLVVRIEPVPRLPVEALGPHLTIVDLQSDSVSDVRKQAMAA